MTELLNTVANIGGIGGVMAVIIFFIYKAQVNQMRSDRRYMEDRMSDMLNAYNKAFHEHTVATVNQTQVQSQLFEWLKGKNGRG